jgi:DNA-binding NarL/FixJ family response regulator
MLFRRSYEVRIQARTVAARERVVVASEDPRFWVGIRQEAPELDSAWVLAGTARECLGAIEDPRVKLVVLDGAMKDKPANQLLQLLRQIRPDLMIVFAVDVPHDECEREARQAGVLYYGDRNRLTDIAGVVRQSLHRGARPRPRPGASATEGKGGWV